MNNRWATMFVTASAAAVLALPGCGCSAGTSAQSNAQSTAESTPASTVPTSSVPSEPAPAADSGDITPKEYSEGWTSAFKGSSGEQTIYYAESPHGTEAIMTIVGPDGQRISYVGTNHNVDAANVTLTDNKSGTAISFSIVSADPASIVLNIGDYGEVTLKPCDISEVAQATS